MRLAYLSGSRFKASGSSLARGDLPCCREMLCGTNPGAEPHHGWSGQKHKGPFGFYRHMKSRRPDPAASADMI